MKLVLRGTDIGRITLWLLKDDQVIETVRLEVRPEDYLSTLNHFLTAAGHSLATIESLTIINGQGSATALRASVTLGNILAWTRGWPLFELTLPADSEDTEVVNHLKDARAVEVVRPAYATNPHITLATHDALRRKM